MIPNPFLSQCKVFYFSHHDTYACFLFQSNEYSLYPCIFHRIVCVLSSSYEKSKFIQCWKSCFTISAISDSVHAAHDSCTYIMIYSILSFYDSCYSPTNQSNSDYIMYILSSNLFCKSMLLIFYSSGFSHVLSLLSVHSCFRSS